jgi:hypothetical protein
MELLALLISLTVRIVFASGATSCSEGRQAASASLLQVSRSSVALDRAEAESTSMSSLSQTAKQNKTIALDRGDAAAKLTLALAQRAEALSDESASVENALKSKPKTAAGVNWATEWMCPGGGSHQWCSRYDATCCGSAPKAGNWQCEPSRINQGVMQREYRVVCARADPTCCNR